MSILLQVFRSSPLLILLITSPSLSLAYDTVQLTDNDYHNTVYSVSGGENTTYVAYVDYDGTDNEIFLFDGTSVTQITDNMHNDNQVSVNAEGKAVWRGHDGNDYEIFLYDGTSVIQITNNSFHDADPRISDNGYITWRGYDKDVDFEIFRYYAGRIQKLTNNTSHESAPQISTNGDIVWQSGHVNSICVYKTDALYPDCIYPGYRWVPAYPRINNNGHIVFVQFDGMDTEIFFYDGRRMRQITDNTFNDTMPVIDNNDRIAWYGGNVNGRSDPFNDEIFFYGGDNIFQLTDNSHEDWFPAINNAGLVVWRGWNGFTYEIYMYNGSAVSQITDSIEWDVDPVVNDNGDVVWRRHDGTDWEIFLTSIVSAPPDYDEDGIPDDGDNCPYEQNADQLDNDSDAFGDACDSDDDNDEVPDTSDNCPNTANPGQSDYDGDGYGDACDDDIDGDMIMNKFDACGSTPLGEVFDPATGCSISQIIPCSGPAGMGDSWKNHGQYVSGINKATADFFERGIITEAERDAIVSEAARSSCGKKNGKKRR